MTLPVSTVLGGEGLQAGRLARGRRHGSRGGQLAAVGRLIGTLEGVVGHRSASDWRREYQQRGLGGGCSSRQDAPLRSSWA